MRCRTCPPAVLELTARAQQAIHRALGCEEGAPVGKLRHDPLRRQVAETRRVDTGEDVVLLRLAELVRRGALPFGESIKPRPADASHRLGPRSLIERSDHYADTGGSSARMADTAVRQDGEQRRDVHRLVNSRRSQRARRLAARRTGRLAKVTAVGIDELPCVTGERFLTRASELESGEHAAPYVTSGRRSLAIRTRAFQTVTVEAPYRLPGLPLEDATGVMAQGHTLGAIPDDKTLTELAPMMSTSLDLHVTSLLEQRVHTSSLRAGSRRDRPSSCRRCHHPDHLMSPYGGSTNVSSRWRRGPCRHQPGRASLRPCWCTPSSHPAVLPLRRERALHRVPPDPGSADRLLALRPDESRPRGSLRILLTASPLGWQASIPLCAHRPSQGSWPTMASRVVCGSDQARATAVSP